MSFIDRLRRLLRATGSASAPGDGSSRCEHISCMEALGRLHEYLDGELEEATLEQVAHHFEVCQRCYPHLHLERRFREVLRQAEEAERAPEHLRREVLELLAAEGEKNS